MSAQTPPHEHLIPAIRNWLLETYDKIYFRIDVADLPDPTLHQYAENGVVVLDTAPGAVRGFGVGPDAVEFNCRFNGAPHLVMIPPTNVIEIIGFDSRNPADCELVALPQWKTKSTVASVSEDMKKQPSTRPKLSVVK